MLKTEAIKFFGTRIKLAKAASVDPSAVSQWGELVPEGRAARLQVASNGALIYDPAVYDQHKQDRKEVLSHENQSIS
ncbi:transcriptional regulator [Salmonella enterica]|uniref:Cro/CI family transcriptional regulator n=1 Tax=Salmonella enterica TaxID=28901 RepID=UPI000F93BC7C|nr:Cro/CI family transcriptional regulator [Salmonella enterica]EBV3389069.1 transcriptional regulator [Salmonella enterica subsp. enterica serovar Virchow]EBY6655468.1 transcriptional regulator [Salmonella enterica subsp. enterica serovar Oranienburg]EEL8285070.1 transcriptional regulator [Salmonella enterica subsp. enterica serovar Agona]EAU0368182.1 transcriptional regulator [Salmonella enterica]EBM3540384.1 transcriptional regulator [Salmonella enterica]